MPLTEDGQAALDLAGDGAGDELAGLERLLERHPGGEALGLVARQDGVAVAVFDGVDGHRDEVADLDFEFALVVLEFVDRNVGFGLEAGVDDHEVVLDAHDFGGDDFAGAHFGALAAILRTGRQKIPAGWLRFGLDVGGCGTQANSAAPLRCARSWLAVQARS